MCFLVKAYIRKSNVLYSMRDYTKAIAAVQEAVEHDTEKQHTKEIQQQEFKCQQALFAQRGNETQEETLNRAMRDPEIVVCLSDLSRPSCIHWPYFYRKSWMTLLCSRSFSKHRRTLRLCKNISRIRSFVKRSRSLSTLVSSRHGDWQPIFVHREFFGTIQAFESYYCNSNCCT